MIMQLIKLFISVIALWSTTTHSTIHSTATWSAWLTSTDRCQKLLEITDVHLMTVIGNHHRVYYLFTLHVAFDKYSHICKGLALVSHLINDAIERSQVW